MSNIQITVVPSPSTGGYTLRFIEQTFDADGIESGRKVGFKPLATGTDPVKALERAKARQWIFGRRNQQTGLYDVLGNEGGVPSGELEHADAEAEA
jgi:hypothetical protein